MDRAQVTAVWPRGPEILLLELDSTALLTNTLLAVKNSCGTQWQLDQPNPNHDCSLTALGQSYEGQDGTWQTSAEYSLVRILTMTPANARVQGTSSRASRSWPICWGSAADLGRSSPTASASRAPMSS